MKKLRFDIANLFLVLMIVNILLHYLIPIKQIIFFSIYLHWNNLIYPWMDTKYLVGYIF